MPAKKLNGILMTSAHGQLMTRNVSALYTHVPQSAGRPMPNIRTRGGRTARAIALYTTAGVYILANFVMNSSDLDLRELAFSTRSRIFETVDSPNSFVVFIFRTPVILIHPLTISSPSATSLGRLSPVSALVFRAALPSITIPSIGTFSPGWTTITEPISTSSGSTCSSFPSVSIFA